MDVSQFVSQFYFRMIETLFADKERELGDTRSEIKALKYSDRLKGKAVEEVRLNPPL